MRFSVDQGALVRELSLVQGIVEKKTTMPILANVALTTTEDGQLTMIATDLEVGLRTVTQASVEVAGRIALHARRLHDIVRRLPSGTVQFSLEGTSMHIRCGSIRYRLAAQDPEQFPALRSHEGNPNATMAAEHLADAVRRVIFAVNVEDPRYTLGGALWELGEGDLTMVATDGHRLAISSRPAQKVGAGFPELLVPRKALFEIGKLAGEQDGDVYLWASPAGLIAVIGQREISTSLQEQRFPDYRRVVPKGNDKVFEVDTDALGDAIERVAVLSNEDTRLIRFDLSEGQLKVSSSNEKLGDAQEDLSITYDGKPVSIGFNAQYLADFLGATATDRVRLSLGEPMGQALLEPVRPGGDARQDRYIVMPMAL
ncbi:MAG: DNA polymerase III subunit beta [Acidobacteria bacterium]|nr:DNA polymerase III subunit beta [Acidobacteriota bacterium]